MNYIPHPEYAAYIEANSHGFIDVWTENGKTCTKLHCDHEPTEEDLRAVELRMKILLDYEMPDGMTMEDIQITGPDGDPLRLRIYRPKNLPEKSPILMNVHGGGWIGGALDIDNSRAIALAQGTPCIVVSVDYRIARNGIHFPKPLQDCVCAYRWLCGHAEEIGGDSKRIALHGTSAGGNLCAGLALYLRDHGNQTPRLTVLNCAALYMDNAEGISAYQYQPVKAEGYNYAKSVMAQYLGGLDGMAPSYYALPGLCPDVSGLGPHAVITAEYEWLRDDSFRYVTRLLRAAVPCEMILAPRVDHAFCAVDSARLTQWTHAGICMSLRREFGMPL